MKLQEACESKNNIERKGQSLRAHIFWPYYEAIAMKTVRHQHSTGTWINRTEWGVQKKSPISLANWVLTEVPSIHLVRERTASSTNGAGTTGYLHAKNKAGPYLIPYTKINSKCDLHVKTKTIKLEENIWVNFHVLGFGYGFLNMTPKHK